MEGRHSLPDLAWGRWVLPLSSKVCIMGVLNVTPDSFSDGGRYLSTQKALERALQMVEEGADIIDVGGESTRPYSEKVTPAEEMDRVLPVIEGLRSRVEVPISIDTYKAEVAEAAISAGAAMVNDISALRFDPRMGPVAAEAGLPVILMHMKGTPQNMQDNPTYEDVTGEIIDFLGEAVGRAVSAGIEEGRIVVDPGIGFGKRFDDNLVILKELPRLQVLEKPILLGSSNKSFIGHVLDRKVDERDAGTMATLAIGVMNGANIVRVHNVKMAWDTVRMVEAVERGRAQA